MENCEHNTHHNDCCVCWFKQSNGRAYPGDIPLFMDKMAALLLGVSWKDYCMNKALGAAKDAFESRRDYLLSDDIKLNIKDSSMIARLIKSQKGLVTPPVRHKEIKPTKHSRGWAI